MYRLLSILIFYAGIQYGFWAGLKGWWAVGIVGLMLVAMTFGYIEGNNSNDGGK